MVDYRPLVYALWAQGHLVPPQVPNMALAGGGMWIDHIAPSLLPAFTRSTGTQIGKSGVQKAYRSAGLLWEGRTGCSAWRCMSCTLSWAARLQCWWRGFSEKTVLWNPSLVEFTIKCRWKRHTVNSGGDHLFGEPWLMELLLMLLTFHRQFASGPEVLNCWLMIIFKAWRGGPEDSYSSALG